MILAIVGCSTKETDSSSWIPLFDLLFTGQMPLWFSLGPDLFLLSSLVSLCSIPVRLGPAQAAADPAPPRPPALSSVPFADAPSGPAQASVTG